MPTTDKHIVSCAGTKASFFYGGAATIPTECTLNGVAEQPLPSWLALVPVTIANPFPYIYLGTIIALTDDAVAAEVILDMGDWTLTITVNATCFESFENCCDPMYNIAWLNPIGGWQNYPFTGVFTKEMRQEGQSSTYEIGLQQRYSERAKIYDGMIVTTVDIPKAHADMLDSLKNSIQAYLYNEETEQFDIPIIVDDGSYVKYKSTDKFWTVSVRFRFAKRRNIQTQ